MIYHIAVKADWVARGDSYAPDGWRAAGFVHCSTADQLERVADRIFAGRRDLVLLTIDPRRLAALVVWEDTAGAGEDFPHVYGSIEVAAVTEAADFLPGPDGTFRWWEPAD